MDSLLGVRSLLDELRFLLDGDRIFLRSGDGGGDDDGGSGGGGGGSGDDDAQDGDDDESQEDDDGSPGGSDDKETNPELRKARRDAARYRKELRTAEKKLAEREKQDLTEQQRAERERDEERKRREELEEQTRGLRAKVVAAETGIHPKRVAAAIALLDADVDFEDEDELKGAFKALKREHEYLFAADDGKGKKPPDADGGTRSGNGGGDKDVTPGAARLRHAYANSEKE